MVFLNTDTFAGIAHLRQKKKENLINFAYTVFSLSYYIDNLIYILVQICYSAISSIVISHTEFIFFFFCANR